MNRATSPHSATPSLVASDPRGLTLRTVGYCRQRADEQAQARIEQHTWNAAGHLHASRDPRGLEYLRLIRGLSGRALLSDSMDAGWKLQLPGEASQPLYAWDARGNHWQQLYDELLRPVQISETVPDGSTRVSERYEYAGAAASLAERNQCGRLLRHDDPAGTLHLYGYSLGGAREQQTRYFLRSLEAVDWPAASAERDRLLESGAGYTTLERYNASGQLRTRSDACGHLTLLGYGIDGRPAATAVQLAGAPAPTPLLTHIEYDSWGQVASRSAANGVISRSTRDAANGRLTRLHCAVPGQAALLDLHYRHDPLGNTVEIVDLAQPVRHFANQRIEPRCEYRHDSLYQLVEASGREFIGVQPGAGLPELQPLPGDPSRQGNYRQHYQYDAAGNLLQLRHTGTHEYTRTFQVAMDSNRALAQDDSRQRSDFDTAFDACGNLRRLLPGQTLDWNPRNQLERLTMVRRSSIDDEERYVHDAAGNRLRKTCQRLASGRTLLSEVRYLPGLELRSDPATGEQLQVILCDGVEVLHWQQGLPQGMENDQQRYQLRDQLGSHTLELDGQATLLSQELHYPFGGTAWWAAASTSQARCKFRRYAGKERDASGLYYYGQRYYAPWLQRWLNPDPAGYVDGANLYRMVGNRPLDFTDWQGTVKIPLGTLLGDVLDPMALQIGTGWFEELSWRADQQGFVSTGTVYQRNMEALESPATWSLSEGGHPVALFNDREGNLRLFANTSPQPQHMAIQPGMGLPLFAGIITRGTNGQILFDNHSGHYKPLAAVGQVEAWLTQLAPGISNFTYQPVSASTRFSDFTRLETINGPEEYADVLARFRNDKTGLIGYLEDNGLWDIAEAEFGNDTVLNVIFEMKARNMTADQVNQARTERDRADLAAAARPKPVHKPRSAPLPNRRTAVITRRSSGILGVFRKCVGR